MKDPNTTKDRKFAFVVYPDSTSYDCNAVLAELQHLPQWSYILHDRDIDWETGELKKPHYHCLVKVPSPVLRSVIANKVGLPPEDIQLISSYKKYARYLIHADDADKVQYSPDDVSANWDYNSVIDLSGDRLAQKIAIFLVNNPRCTQIELFAYCCENGLYAEYRRAYKLFADLRQEQRMFAGLSGER